MTATKNKSLTKIEVGAIIKLCDIGKHYNCAVFYKYKLRENNLKEDKGFKPLVLNEGLGYLALENYICKCVLLSNNKELEIIGMRQRTTELLEKVQKTCLVYVSATDVTSDDWNKTMNAGWNYH